MTSTQSNRTSVHGKRSVRAVPPAPKHDKSAETKAIESIAGQPTFLQTDASPSPLPRGTKQRLVLELLQREDGATLNELTAATSWLPHTTRAALTRLRQGGYDVVRTRREGRVSAYTCTGLRTGCSMDATSDVSKANTSQLPTTLAS